MDKHVRFPQTLWCCGGLQNCYAHIEGSEIYSTNDQHYNLDFISFFFFYNVYPQSTQTAHASPSRPSLSIRAVRQSHAPAGTVSVTARLSLSRLMNIRVCCVWKRIHPFQAVPPVSQKWNLYLALTGLSSKLSVSEGLPAQSSRLWTVQPNCSFSLAT